MNAAMILIIIPLVLSGTSIVITTCSIAAHFYKKRKNRIEEALRFLEKRPKVLWEEET